MCAEKKLDEPITEDFVEMVPNKQPIGKAFKKDGKIVTEYITKLTTEEINKVEKELEAGEHKFTVNGREFAITKDMILSVKRGQRKVHVEELTPSVVEPSFGIGRVMYSLFEHNFRMREGDEQRRYFSLPPIIAPIKCSVLPLSGNKEFTPLVRSLSRALTDAEVSHKVDDSSGSIGRRYSRTDEVAVPFGICVDFDSLKEPHTVTLRERDSTLQVRIPAEDIPDVLRKLSLGKMTWDNVMGKYPKFEQQEASAK